ncbi:DUF1292 domain-containing protein [Clostridium perfringens]|uniref:DUF1292 domain-containing protein n=1 Tax=Clostridium perfringens TaxID=1502 RepID=UPI0013E33145|nr:DUF1292 domain-containing protein [Clostridium perfringens]MDM0869130.1 DUF1292 domain-containing protein [Clostridium perfringens]MDM0872057.1 DUF1292 domain-containing protein [Clostridium perfringens]MDM1022517.1 DUF1292 domain-containing protein [Clostridium perfringens]NGT68604.1 DUF1292 domain-containing protein [Clostridium perfringens]NGT82610.1 DUF1292 domain-containing protein [Clostridium perfringens]
MSDKDLNKCCGGNCGCGSEKEEKHEGCGCGGHGHDHGHDHHEGCGDEHLEHFVVDLEDEEGNTITCDVIDAFEYKDEEYVLVQHPDESVYLFKSQGEEGELVLPSEEEFDEVVKFYEENVAE